MKLKLIRQLIVLLLHAQKCQTRATTNPNAASCMLPHCKTMRDVLNHMKTCKIQKDCSTLHCSVSRHVFGHWENCKRLDCPLCMPLRKKLHHNHAPTNVDSVFAVTNPPSSVSVATNISYYSTCILISIPDSFVFFLIRKSYLTLHAFWKEFHCIRNRKHLKIWHQLQ